ncbi:membrane protein [Actinomadura sp. NBRC 104425]|uniref:DMT family transporter n=1 Tax=Actinomadura sp. NBRC 104425 TaxID=3032204 RepID=UPI0024A2CB13|nr:DMT family transporter [Actinomadura sp. NBRC 104425]GLZ12925.1 membrane protein [Actinomadura sp. NBRC 104425]
MIIAIVFALCAAASNALSSVLQRRAARSVAPGDSFQMSVLLRLVRDTGWLLGIGALIAGFLFQAAALTVGQLALVQPILVTELPFTMAFIWLLLGRRLDREAWTAVGAMTVGLALLLAAADPGHGTRTPHRIEWAIAILVTVGLMAFLVSSSRAVRGPRRAVLLAVASGLGFSFTAALMKEATLAIPGGAVAVLTSWALYAMVAAGLASLVLLQDALRSGTLVAVQPGLNVTDPVASIAYGVGLFGESIRLGGWAVPELLGIGLILYGSIHLARPLRDHDGGADAYD